jgi:hypothetical protein
MRLKGYLHQSIQEQHSKILVDPKHVTELVEAQLGVLQFNINTAKKSISKRIKVDPDDLDYIGKDKMGLYYFNVTDKRHPEYQSTKTWRKK